MTHVDSPVSARFQVDEERRTITGLAVPYGPTASSGGRQWAFSKGSLTYGDVSRVKVLIGHDFARAVGVVTNLDDADDGLYMTARIAKGAAGDEALSMAAEGVWDGLSIGLGEGIKARNVDGVNHTVSAPLREISITPVPSFDDARLTSVTASAEGTPMTTTATEAAAPAAATEAPDTYPSYTVSGVLTGTVTEMDATETAASEAAGYQAQPGTRFAVQGRQVVSAGRPVTQVVEPVPYRFDGAAGTHSLIDDMKAAQQGDTSARQRFETFVNETFAVTTTNVAGLNPTQNRPELYVPNLQYTSPLWDAVTTGAIADRTPFTIPRFGSASGLVGVHTEGVEPTPGALNIAGSQTVTPTALSGKIEIDREVLDQGGSPQADGIIWGEMLNAWFEAREQRIATALAGVATAELNLASATDTALVAAMTNYFAGLQFVRGGNRYTGLVLDGMLFPALVNAKDTTGRNLLPVISPMNAQGQTSGAFDSIQIGNQTGRAAWALGATNASRSYSFVPSSVLAWSSAPQKFEFQYQVKSVDMAIWGYAASAVLRDSDVKPIDYTTADV